MAQIPTLDTKDRVNIVYKSKANQNSEDTELPFKMLVLGNFTQNTEDRDSLEDRESIAVTRENFDDILKGLNVKLNLLVENNLTPQAQGKIPISLKFNSMADFEPDNLVQSLDPLKHLADLRRAFKTVKRLFTIYPDLTDRLNVLLNQSNAPETDKEPNKEKKPEQLKVMTQDLDKKS
jgi:type VI secretion system protein ImpB